jgi:hypothetical protein
MNHMSTTVPIDSSVPELDPLLLLLLLLLKLIQCLPHNWRKSFTLCLKPLMVARRHNSQTHQKLLLVNHRSGNGCITTPLSGRNRNTRLICHNPFQVRKIIQRNQCFVSLKVHTILVCRHGDHRNSFIHESVSRVTCKLLPCCFWARLFECF